MPEAKSPVGLICSVPLEAAPVLERLRGARPLHVGGRHAYRGELEGTDVLLVIGGMGKTNAAQALTALLERHPVRAVIGFGVGGAYPGSGSEVGDLVVATVEVYGDEGVATPGGWISTEEIGIPLLESGGERRFNEFPLAPERVADALATLREEGLHARGGVFVTVSCCSGVAARGRELADRFDAACETMEGAAYAHVCAHYGTPFLEVRGISNQVEDRDLSRWRLHDAAAAAGRGTAALVKRL